MNKILDYIFCIILFVALFLPTNDYTIIESIGITLKSVLFVILFVIYIFYPLRNNRKINFFLLDKKIIIFFFLIFINEIILKPIVYNETIHNGLKSYYIGMPFILSLGLLVLGLKIDIKLLWKTLLLSVFVSVIISFILTIVYIPFLYPNIIAGDTYGIDGRLSNANASFGLISLIILMNFNDRWFARGLFAKLTFILSIISLIMTFNRTYLGLLILLYFILFYLSVRKGITMKKTLVLSSIPIFFILFSVYLYQTNFEIHEQINERILYLFDSSIQSSDRLFENNRDVIYNGIINRIEEGYWIIGLPFSIPIFIDFFKEGAKYTDSSLVNILLRFGIIPLFLYLGILLKMYKKSATYLFSLSLVIFFLASFNIDSLFRHNTIFFLTVLFYVDLWNSRKTKNENIISHKRKLL